MADAIALNTVTNTSGPCIAVMIFLQPIIQKNDTYQVKRSNNWQSAIKFEISLRHH